MKLQQIDKLLDTPIQNVDWSVRALNILISMGVKTIGDLIQKNAMEFLRERNAGKKTVAEVQERLAALNLSLGTDIRNVRINNCTSLEKISLLFNELAEVGDQSDLIDELYNKVRERMNETSEQLQILTVMYAKLGDMKVKTPRAPSQ